VASPFQELSRIFGEQHVDHRGVLRFVNDFFLDEVKRFYIVHQISTKVVRAWQAHMKEKKHFFVLSGSFLVGMVKIDNWKHPSVDLKVHRELLRAEDNCILVIPPGFANGFRALKEESSLLVFSTATLQESKLDDYRYDKQLWMDWSVV